MIPLRRRAFAGLLLASGLAAAQTTANTPRLRMAYFDRYPPLSERGVDGRMRGLLIELVEAIGAAADLQFSHQGYPWVRGQAMVRDGLLDGVCTTVNTARRAYLLFCDTPLLRLPFGICHRLDDGRIASLRSLADLRRLRQGNYRGSGYTQTFLDEGRMRFDHDPDSVLRRIAMGDLDVYVDAELNTRHRIQALGLQQRLGYTAVDFLPIADYCFGLRRQHPQADLLVARMEAATQAARSNGQLEALAAPYFSRGGSAPPSRPSPSAASRR